MKFHILAGIFVLIMMVVGCSQNPYGTAYSTSDARRMQQVLTGTVVHLNAVTIDSDSAGTVGTVGGAAIGGILGSAVGAGKGSDLAAVGGGLLGGYLGNKAGTAVGKENGVNISVKLDSGKTVAIVQQVDPNQIFHVGDRVNVYNSGGTSRVVLAN
ncbi:MAG: glycine zipper 2TM domain-containing protein [Cellvibrionales bacterium]|nr:glycine zipper 2TM domain-containing protein [Cellvibrionales bacterium]